MVLKRTSGFWLMLALLMFSTGLAAQKKGEYHSRRHTDVVPEDGAAFIDRMHYDDKSKLMYYISNDDERIYIDIVIADKPTMQKVMMFGMITWINPEGKTKKVCGVRFPMVPERRDLTAPAGREPGRDRSRMAREMMEARNREMAVFGLGGLDQELIINPSTDKDYRGSVRRLDEDRMLIAISLPLEKIGRSAGKNFEKPISIGFESGYLDLNKQGMGMRSGQMSSGGPPSGGHPPMDGGRPDNDMGKNSGSGQKNQFNLNEMSKPAKLWLKTVILSEMLPD